MPKNASEVSIGQLLRGSVATTDLVLARKNNSSSALKLDDAAFRTFGIPLEARFAAAVFTNSAVDPRTGESGLHSERGTVSRPKLSGNN